MTVDRTHPDLLRRFVPTPYVFGGRDGSNNIFIESNDLEIALSYPALRHPSTSGGEGWRTFLQDHPGLDVPRGWFPDARRL